MSTKTVKKHRLYDVELTEISLVDRPANTDARVVLMKRDEDNMDVNSPDTPNTPAVEDSGLSVLTKALEEAEERLNELAKGLDEAITENERLSAEIDALNSENELLKSDIAKRDLPEETPLQAILKSADEPVRKAFEELSQRLAAAEVIAKRAADEAEVAEYIAKAEAYANLPASAEVLGPLLRRVAKGLSSAEDVGELERLLSAANTALAGGTTTGDTFAEVGKRGAGSVSAADQLAVAAEAIQKAEAGLSQAEAFTKVLEQNPGLYTQYIAERRNPSA